MSSESQFNNQALAANTRLDEYRLDRVLGQGGFAITYLATDLSLDRQVAIKEYLPSDWALRDSKHHIVPKNSEMERDFSWGKRTFVEEAKLLAKLNHPNIVRVFRYFEALDTAYIVLELVDDGSLWERIKSKSLTPATIIQIADVLSDSLAHVHSYKLKNSEESAVLLHRDISPDNILFRKSGAPVLIDFGAARQVVSGKSRAVSSIVKDGYAPAEQYGSASKHMGPWTDIYALSSVLYECITGNRLSTATDRLLEDSNTKKLKELSLANYSDAFLSAIDEGVKVRPHDRPKSVQAWRSKWLNENSPRKINQNAAVAGEKNTKKTPNIPILNDKYSQQNKENTKGNEAIAWLAIVGLIILVIVSGPH